jgi:hypothetical protein
MGARNDHTPHEKSKEGTNKSFLEQKEMPRFCDRSKIHGGSAIGVLGAGLDPPSLILFFVRRVH